ncbi:MAG: hypothetical protein H0T42_06460 [Deltaproteobacteria bacterium]|nr:hypothetical protein [Deltaproteobacteria bacterium]
MRAAIVVVLLTAGVADARPFDKLQGGALLHYEVTGLHGIEDTRGETEAQDLVLAGFRLHGFVGMSSTIGYHIGIDLAAGSSLNAGGFAYDVAVFPVGVSARFGRTGVVMLGAGVGASGAVGTLDDAVTLPLELNAEIGDGRLRLLARVRTSYVAGADSRQSAAPSIPFADELDATLGLRVGRHYEDWGMPSGNGYFLGVAYRELAGTRFLGLVLGYSIDGATKRKEASKRHRGELYGCADCDQP